MARVIYFYLLALVILIITPFPQSVIADDTKTYIVTLKQGVNVDAHFEWVKREQGKTTVRMNTDAPRTADPAGVLKVFSIGSANGYVGQLSESWVTNVLTKRSDVKTVELNGKVKVNFPVGSTAVPTNVMKDAPKHLDMMDTSAKPLFDKSYTYPAKAGAGVNVYIVDTGIRTTHVEFEGRAKMAKTICEGCPDTDDNGHGSHVSGIVGGKTVGVANKVSLFGVKVLDSQGSGTYDDVIAGLQFVSDQKKASSKEIFVVNMSLGGPTAEALNDIVEALSAQGVHVVVAAGNDGADACDSSPAGAKSAICVGAAEDFVLANTDWSNFGPCLDIFAPGYNVLSCGISDDKEYVEMSGTSMASPHVAGMVALILAENGEMTPKDLDTFIQAKALANKMYLREGTTEGTPNLFASIGKMF